MAGHSAVAVADGAVRHHGPVLLRVLTWNVNGAGADRRRVQGAFLASRDLDVALLTETRYGTATNDYAAWLAESGLGHRATGFGQAGATGTTSGDPGTYVGSTGLTDAFRHVHGYEVAESSWSAFRPGKRFDYRLDHVLVRGGLVPLAARYLQDARERRSDGVRLSDHAALEVRLELPA